MLCSSIFSSPEAPYRSECNVVSQYDWRSLDAAAVPLRQDKLHHVGISSETYYFLDIGPCRWGIQNFEYDKGEGIWWTSVYLLQEEPRSKFTLFAVDGKAAPEERKSPFGKKSFLALKKEGARDEANEILGYAFPLGQTGIYAFGNGFFYFAEPRKTEEGFHSGTIYLYKREIGGESPFVLVGE